MRGSEVMIKLSDMKLLSKPKRWHEKLSISVTEKGYMAFSTALYEQLFENKDKRSVHIYLTDDRKIIAVNYEQESDFVIPSGKRMKFTELAKDLEKHGYNIPAKYIVEWNEHTGAWVGVLQEVSEAPKLKNKRKK